MFPRVNVRNPFESCELGKNLCDFLRTLWFQGVEVLNSWRFADTNRYGQVVELSDPGSCPLLISPTSYLINQTLRQRVRGHVRSDFGEEMRGKY